MNSPVLRAVNDDDLKEVIDCQMMFVVFERKD